MKIQKIEPWRSATRRFIKLIVVGTRARARLGVLRRVRIQLHMVHMCIATGPESGLGR